MINIIINSYLPFLVFLFSMTLLQLDVCRLDIQPIFRTLA